MQKVIFFGNGLLADAAIKVLRESCEVIFYARTREDLAEVIRVKKENPEAFGVLASFGVLIKADVLELFGEEGILNLHPSLLPEYRGPSPIESAILDGANDFSYSIMKLVKAMDAGPVYHQDTLKGLKLDKSEIYREVATAGTKWLVENLDVIRKGEIKPAVQDEEKATYTKKLDKTLSLLKPEEYTAEEILRQIVAYQMFPKPKYAFFGKTCIILKAHVIDVCTVICDRAAVEMKNSPLMLRCKDRNFVVIDELQPEGKKPMDAISFKNGYGKKR